MSSSMLALHKAASRTQSAVSTLAFNSRSQKSTGPHIISRGLVTPSISVSRRSAIRSTRPTLLPIAVHRSSARFESTNFFTEFYKSFKRQVAENREFQQNVQQLSASTKELAESDAVQRAKDAMDKTSKGTSKVFEKVGETVDKVVENPVVKKTGEVLYTAGEKVAEVGQKVAEPILDTKAAKAVGKGIKHVKTEVIDSSDSAFFHEYVPREQREKERAELLAYQQSKMPLGIPGVPNPNRIVTADPEAGQNVELHRSSKLAESWRKFKEDSPIAQKLFAVRRGIDESDNPVVERIRDFFSSSAFEETETARVVSALKAVDPTFRTEKFLKEATKYFVPEILEAYLKAEAPILREWCSERAYARLSAGFEAQQQQGLVSDCKLLDIRHVDIRKLTLLEDEVPVILVTFQTNEILIFRNRKGELKLGNENAIETATYVMAFTKAQCVDPSATISARTNGWIVIDWSRSTGW
ncbi:uncharacterized protein EV422DRAFT_521546 [Fimicolochytrium jonesii]|uniref:uncharacterized protein n=1 Tax=Fimicolochytrium jonesii TaxID=1396493 RepID=UPI0022FF315B|nr:uncharacterized protein EV422DRAFT_521546 [Fimicolochytrium jonesii]KAI8823576.1 hypothetical protein EV422DRAFT_521546 [Fimicolochytrium jonesii]